MQTRSPSTPSALQLFYTAAFASPASVLTSQYQLIPRLLSQLLLDLKKLNSGQQIKRFTELVQAVL